MVRAQDKRRVGSYQEYPGATVWYEYEYRCPECRQWHPGSDVTQVHADGTESVLCADCADKVEFPVPEEPDYKPNHSFGFPF